MDDEIQVYENLTKKKYLKNKADEILRRKKSLTHTNNYCERKFILIEFKETKKKKNRRKKERNERFVSYLIIIINYYIII